MSEAPDELVYLALGGAGEIGMNCYLYGYGSGHRRRWIIVDFGLGFGDMDTAPGVEVIVPDISFLEQERDRIDGIVLTHAHEDHIGAIQHLWRRLGVPIHARPFTAELVRRSMGEAGLDIDAIREVDLGQRVAIGPFTVEWLPVTHSIPEASCLAIRTPSGLVVHSGDFKLDPEPLFGNPIDMAQFDRLGEEGVLAFACDSTNILMEGAAGSESEIAGNLERLIAQAPGAVAATTFASNVGRLRTLANAARDSGRSIVVIGRAMRRMIEVAVMTEQLTDFPPTIPEDRAKDMPREKLFYLVTGSQGENRAALARIAGGTHPTVTLGKGDTVLFSSKNIPGNEAGIYRLHNRLSERGVHVIDSDMERIHVSGHARRGDLERVYKALKPRIAVPNHGEHRHLVEHAKWTQRWGVPESIIATDGTMVRLDGNAPGVIEHIETGRVYIDGRAQIGALDGVIRERLKMARQGVVICSLVVDDEGELLADTDIRCLGTPKDSKGWDMPLEDLVGEAVDEAIDQLPVKARRKDAGIEEAASRAIRRVIGRHWGKKPVLAVMITRLEE